MIGLGAKCHKTHRKTIMLGPLRKIPEPKVALKAEASESLPHGQGEEDPWDQGDPWMQAIHTCASTT